MDYYTRNPSRLKGQPKKTIGDYVARHGILVPKRFASFNAAKRSGLEIIARSEHTQDYAGVSGLVDSLLLSNHPDVKDERELKDKVLSEPDYLQAWIESNGCNIEEFKSRLSFTYWEFIRGTNHAVVADSCIKNRYHITSAPRGYEWGKHNYSIIENGQAAFQACGLAGAQLQKIQKKLMQIYEEVRHLRHFDPSHCPIMEFVSAKGKIYFLQYHITRDFDPSGFILDREPEDGEISVPFVRGKTQEEGMTCKTIIYYVGQYYRQFRGFTEEGSTDSHADVIFSELQVRKRKLQLIDSSKNIRQKMTDLIRNHTNRSLLFKPQVSVICDTRGLWDNEECNQHVLAGIEYSVMMHVVSDGRKCYIKRVG